ncbi:MAG: pilus assembly protein PilM [Oligoflexia bacterium]|nr:pilus assembly protein PilM [Oligoflexia bacterium]
MIINKKILGLDLGNRNLRGTLLYKENDSIILYKYFSHDLASGNDQFPEKNDLFENLKICLNVHELNKSITILGIGNNMRSLDLLQLPIIPEDELDSAIESELENKLLTNPQNLCYDFYTIRNTLPETSNYNQFKLFYTEKNIIFEMIKSIKSVSLKPIVIDAEILALSTIVVFNNYVTENKSHIIIDMGENHTTIGLQIGDQLIHHHTLIHSIGSITKKLNDDFAIKYKQSELYKKLLNNDNPNDKIENIKALETLQNTYVEILNEIQIKIDSFSSYFEKYPLDTIFFFGGGHELIDCCKIFKERYNVNVITPNPFKNINIHQYLKYAPNDIILKRPHSMAVAVGFALRGLL